MEKILVAIAEVTCEQHGKRWFWLIDDVEGPWCEEREEAEQHWLDFARRLGISDDRWEWAK